jgi:2',3'-cyclic-nucleotide 2'-phosphodiesterase (5'-nucleotidase family)
MKHTSRVFYSVVTLLLVVSVGWGQPDIITILHVNDTHSNLASIGSRTDDLRGTLGGLARVATIVEKERCHERDVLFLHAGDFSIGDLFYTKYFGVPELQMLKHLGLDAMTVGNHEFDLTPATLLQTLQTAFPHRGFPLLSANLNLDHPDVQALKEYIQPYVIKRMGRVKIGIFGMTTPATNLLSQPSPAIVEGMNAEELLGIAGTTVAKLRDKGCDVIICLSHLGLQADQALAMYVPGINVIVGGHDHFTFEKPIEVVGISGDPTWIVQAGAFYLNVGKMRLKVHKNEVKMLSYDLIPVNKRVREDPVVSVAVRFLIRGIEGTYGPLFSQQIGYVTAYFNEIAEDLSNAGSKDTPIGNLVADAYREQLGTDIGIQAGGSTAQGLYPGPIVPADLFRVSGYGFNTVNGLGYQMATFSMTGAALMAGLEYGVSDIEGNYDEFLIQVSGMQYSYNPLAAPFSRVSDVLVDGQPLESDKTYTIAGNEFVPVFLTAVGIPFSDLTVHTGITEFQTLMAYVVGKAQPLSPLVQGRIVCAPETPSAKLAEAKAKEPTAVALPAEFRLDQNYPNPFNPTTTVAYDLPAPVHVRLTVYNMLGQEVAQLVSADQAAGRYTALWNASGYASGLYIMRLEAGPYSAIRKMQLVK